MLAVNEQRWIELWRAAGLAIDPESAFHELVEHYSAPDRHYHNLLHIDACLKEFDGVRHLAEDPMAIELAIWFHDIIYDTHATDNEARSAVFAQKRLSRAGAGERLIGKVGELILATRHNGEIAGRDAQLLVDIDLAILGQSEGRFRQYEEQIRQEYAWVPQEAFATKRAEILEAFLAREWIFGTDAFRTRYEESARRNLRSSIWKLRGAS